MNKIAVISIRNDYNTKFIIIDKKTSKVIDDNNGRGYKYRKLAYSVYKKKYNNRGC